MKPFARFARTSRGLMGQYDAKVDAFKFYQEAIDILRGKATAQRMDLAEYLRTICLVDAYGPEHLTRLMRRRFESVRTKGDEPATPLRVVDAKAG